MAKMTREEAIAFFEDMNECTYGNLEAVEMAISALSAEGEYVKKEDILNELGDTNMDILTDEVKEIVNGLPSYSIPDSAEIENTTVYVLKAILRHGHCYCDSEGLPAYKAIKNAIAIITSLERLKDEIKCNTERCECVPDGSCIRVDKVLEIIDKHIGGKDK